MKFVTTASAVTVLALVAALAGASSASANTAPNAYTPAGSAWVNVPVADRVYLESFGDNWDDSSIRSVAAGITCTVNGVTAVGPFLTATPLGNADCVDAASAPYDPIDDATRLGAVELGFPINFFGTIQTSVWPSTNGGMHFGSPDTQYDSSAAEMVIGSDGSAMFPLSADLYYDNTQSNFWTAKTTVDGHTAVVFSWERFHNCCNSGATPEDMTFQLVLIDAGSGDFNAQFNYSSFAAFDEGIDAPLFLIDLGSGVTPGSNVVVADNVTGATAACTPSYVSNIFGAPTDSGFITSIATNPSYFTLVDAAAKTLALWSDPTCTVPLAPTSVQDVATNGYAYLELTDNSSPFNAVSAGWGNYNTTNGQITTTEFVRNINVAELENGQPSSLNQRTLNSTVPGRFLIGQRAGVTVTDPALLGIAAAAAPAPVLAATGVSTDLSLAGSLVGVMMLLGAAGVVVGRRSRTI